MNIKTKIKLLIIIMTLSFLSVKPSFAEELLIEVVRSEPIFEEIYIEQETSYVKQEVITKPSKTSEVINKLIGVGIGFAIGHQIGGGSGKEIAEVTGAIIGYEVSDELTKNSSEIQTKYIPKKQYIKGKAIVGYRNIGYLGDKKIIKISKKKLDYIRIIY